jgi:hypothetical protein
MNPPDARCDALKLTIETTTRSAIIMEKLKINLVLRAMFLMFIEFSSGFLWLFSVLCPSIRLKNAPVIALQLSYLVDLRKTLLRVFP